MARDTLGEVIVTDLVVRSAPGVGANSTLLEDGLTADSLVYVIDGPEPADGYDWLLVAEVVAPSEPMAFGWIAPASREGEEWVRSVPADCPAEVSVEAFASVPGALLLACFAGEELTLEGALGFCGHGDPALVEPTWLANELCNFDAPGRPLGASSRPALSVRIEPGTSIPSFTGEPRPLRIAGRLDHPAAESCRYIEGAELHVGEISELALARARYQCRLGFVVESAERID